MINRDAFMREAYADYCDESPTPHLSYSEWIERRDEEAFDRASEECFENAMCLKYPIDTRGDRDRFGLND